MIIGIDAAPNAVSNAAHGERNRTANRVDVMLMLSGQPDPPSRQATRSAVGPVNGARFALLRGPFTGLVRGALTFSAVSPNIPREPRRGWRRSVAGRNQPVAPGSRAAVRPGVSLAPQDSPRANCADRSTDRASAPTRGRGSRPGTESRVPPHP